MSPTLWPGYALSVTNVLRWELDRLVQAKIEGTPILVLSGGVLTGE
jgi:hypothetical protein